ncbi:O-antigen ligase family protein [Kitasatospora atroaurantiaca]|uniref:O-antigen ligase n=1 Tax=Kitasatospora atroaurantiaca TaxID=285545 RepID=A0A561EX17_9ACTN|nr:O-antigen ligase family protein [Kitasatospora atroaurantiaca]TWE20160.1 O-antigen ligase [Kitasatospora atroaurantiaca]
MALAPPQQSSGASSRPLVLRKVSTGLAARPSLLAAATVLLVCVPSGEKDVTAAVHITAADLASLALVALTALELLRGRTPALSRTACVLFGAVVCAAAAATICSIDPATSLTGFVRLVQVFVLVPASVLCSLRDRLDQRLILGSFVVAALIQGVVGANQYLTRTGASYTGQPIRAVGTFGALDIMAMSTVVSFGLLSALALALGERGSGGSRRLRWAMYAAAAFLAFPLAVSFSRGSWIACGAAVAVLLLRADARLAVRSTVLALAAAVVLVGGLGLGSSGVTERLSSIGSVSAAPDQSVSDRYDLWSTAGRIWQDHPVTGAGPKAFQQLRDSHAPLRLSSGSDAADATIGFQREPLLSPHNMYFLVLSEQGLIGMIAYAALFLTLLIGCLRSSYGLGSPPGALDPAPTLALLARQRAGGAHPPALPPSSVARRSSLSAPARPSARSLRGPGLAALALLSWVLVDFLYADIGGTTTVLTSVVLGLAARSALPGPNLPGVRPA